MGGGWIELPKKCEGSNSTWKRMLGLFGEDVVRSGFSGMWLLVVMKVWFSW